MSLPASFSEYKLIIYDEIKKSMTMDRKKKQRQINDSMITQKRKIDKIYLPDIAVVIFFQNM